MCPISVTDTSIHLIRKFASRRAARIICCRRCCPADAAPRSGRARQFMTERAGGSDVGAIETTARCEVTACGGSMATNGSARMPTPTWRCCWRGRRARRRHQGTCAVRPAAPAEGRPPQRLPHRSPQGQARHPLDGVAARSGWRARSPIWSARPTSGLKQMMEQVNLSRLSHGVRAAAMMRRCVNEALTVHASRVAFGKTIIEYPLLRRQLLEDRRAVRAGALDVSVRR